MMHGDNEYEIFIIFLIYKFYVIAANIKVTAITTTSILEQQLNTPKYTQSFQRVIQTIPTNVVPITQPAIKVITPNQPPATALVVGILFLFH